MRLIDRENRNRKGVDPRIDVGIGTRVLGLGVKAATAAFYRRYDRFTCRLIIPVRSLFLARGYLQLISIKTTASSSSTFLPLLLRSSRTHRVFIQHSIHTQRPRLRWAACYFAFSKHASGLVIAKLLNEFSIPQRNCATPRQKHEAGKRARIPRKRHGTWSDAIFMTSYGKRSLCKNPEKDRAVIFYRVALPCQNNIMQPINIG